MATNEALAPPMDTTEFERQIQAEIAAKLTEKRSELKEVEAAEKSEPQLRVVVPPEALALQEELEMNVAGGPAPRALSPARQAKMDYRNGDFQGAVESYKKALESNNRPKLHLGYGKALYRVGSDGPAERELHKAERAGVADEEAYSFLIDLLRRRGDDAGANAYKEKLKRYLNR
jgi:Flp pilus assembly protein TadD